MASGPSPLIMDVASSSWPLRSLLITPSVSEKFPVDYTNPIDIEYWLESTGKCPPPCGQRSTGGRL